MKVCPVCKAKAFDDAAVCYGCLHRFGAERSSPMGRHGVLPSQRCDGLPPDEPPPECYEEGFGAPDGAVRLRVEQPYPAPAAPGAPPAPAAQARWLRGPDGRWRLQIDVSFAGAGC